MYDLTLIPIKSRQGQPIQEISGFMAAAPPKRPARSRSDDLLIVSLILSGEAEIPSDIQAAWLERLSQSFFKTSGSVTSALRALIETLNLTLMEKNLKLAKEGGWTTGAINLAAIHRRSLYIAQSGETHAFTLTHAGLGHYCATGQADRGLGMSRTPSIRYFQVDLGTGGYLFMTDSPPETWREDLLLADGFPSLETLRRRLLNQAPVDFRLDWVQIRPGEGDIQTLFPTGSSKTSSPEPEDERPPIEPPAQLITTLPVIAQGDTQEVTVSEAIELQKGDLSTTEIHEELDAQHLGDSQKPVATSNIGRKPQATEAARNPKRDPSASNDRETLDAGSKENAVETKQKPKLTLAQLKQAGLQGLASFFDGWHAIWNKIGVFFRNLLTRISPDKERTSHEPSRRTLLWIAVLVPILVAAIALGVYLSRGRRLQYDVYFGEAQAAVERALAAEDPAVERSTWYEALDVLDQADDIRDTEEVANLRQEIQNALDILDGALRLAYQPALADTLSTEIDIREIISYGLDLYLFDEASGWVIHAMQENDIYEVDTDFLCAPGNYSGGSLGRIVDMVSLPINNAYQAHLLVIDEMGNAAYCAPEQAPIVQVLPSSGGSTGEVLRIAYENNTLYVLNPSMNTIWVYGVTNGQFLDPPENYFEGAAAAEIPDLTQIVDFDVNGPELYLLQGNGGMVNCVFSGLPDNPVACENPVTYLDGRPGLEDQAFTLPEGSFSKVFYTPPPTPLVNILDATHGEVFRFSLRFRLYQRLRPDLGDYEVTASEATAFTIGEIEPLAFIAFGNQLFYAYIE